MKDGETIRYRAAKEDCDAYPLKAQYCPKVPARKITRSIRVATLSFRLPDITPQYIIFSTEMAVGGLHREAQHCVSTEPDFHVLAKLPQERLDR